MDQPTREYAHLWRNEKMPSVQILEASFQKFTFSKHWHDELAIGLIERGAEGLDYQGSRLVIPEKHIVAINPTEIHTGFAGCDTGWTYKMFYFDVAFLGRVLDSKLIIESPYINKPIINDPQLYQLFEQLYLSLSKPSLDLSKDSLALLLLTHLFKKHGDSNEKISNFKITKDLVLYQRIKDYLVDSWESNIGLQELETLTNLNKYQIIRGFSNTYGITPHQFLLVLKINKAKTLLNQGWSCADTALECGFFDQSHFSRNFKRAFGLPPGHYQI